MRKIAILSGFLGIAFLFATSASSLQGYVDTLNAAKSLKADYTVNVIGGAKKTFSVELSKPNMARIDKQNELIIADGKDILTYDKKAMTYYKRPQTESEFTGLFRDDELSFFRPFFDAKSFAGISVSDGGAKTRKGMQLRMFAGSMDKGRKQANFYLDNGNIARQVELVYPDKDIRWLIDTQNFNVNGEVSPADAFAFKAPSGSRELSLEEMAVGKWFHNFDEAVKIAKATNKIVMIDFMTTWCGPCKMMAAEAFTADSFMAKAKDFVLCKLDAEIETGLAAQYKVDAYPTVVFIKPDGTMIHKFVGYGGTAQVLGDMDKALAAR